MNDVRPVILGQGHVTKALADDRFFEVMPEFRSLRVKITTMHADLTTKRGCGSCKKSRVARNLYGEFITLVRSLGSDGLTRLKAYFGIGQLMINTLNTQGRAEVRVL